MELKELDTLTDQQLTQIASRCGDILKRRDDDMKAKTLADIATKDAEHEAWKKKMLEGAGLTAAEERPKGKRAKKPKKEAAYKSGHVYQHPDNSKLEWFGHGKTPDWVKQLETKGLKPLDKGIRPQLTQTEIRKAS